MFHYYQCHKKIFYIFAPMVVLYLLLFMIQNGVPENLKFLNSLQAKTEINFLYEYPTIEAEECLKTSPFIGGV